MSLDYVSSWNVGLTWFVMVDLRTLRVRVLAVRFPYPYAYQYKSDVDYTQQRLLSAAQACVDTPMMGFYHSSAAFSKLTSCHDVLPIL